MPKPKGRTVHVPVRVPPASPPALPVKRNPWRPRKYDSPDALLRAAESYFEERDRLSLPVTLSGCVLALGFADRQALDEYRTYSPGFSLAVKAIRSTVARTYEERLHLRDCVGAIFALKNVDGWTDRSEVEMRGLIGSLSLDKLDDGQLGRVLAGEHVLSVLAERIPLKALPAPQPS